VSLPPRSNPPRETGLWGSLPVCCSQPVGGWGADAHRQRALDVDDFRFAAATHSTGWVVAAIVTGFHLVGAREGMAGLDRLLDQAIRDVGALAPGALVGAVNTVTVGMLCAEDEAARVAVRIQSCGQLSRGGPRYAVGAADLAAGNDQAVRRAVSNAVDDLRERFPRDWLAGFSRAGLAASPLEPLPCGR
jgi:hypothetical protein